MIVEIMDAVSIPVMAKARIGHFVEAQVLEALGVDYIDESEVLTPADEDNHIDKHQFKVPFVCGCRDLGEALRRIAEGAAMIRTKGEAGTGNIVEAVRHIRAVHGGIRRSGRDARGRAVRGRQGAARPDRARPGRGARTASCRSSTSSPGVSRRRPTRRWRCSSAPRECSSARGIFKSEDPARTAHAIVQATTHFDNPTDHRRGFQGPGNADEGHRVEHHPGGRAAGGTRLVAGRSERATWQ